MNHVLRLVVLAGLTGSAITGLALFVWGAHHWGHLVVVAVDVSTAAAAGILILYTRDKKEQT